MQECRIALMREWKNLKMKEFEDLKMKIKSTSLKKNENRNSEPRTLNSELFILNTNI